ncbi:hypothetical protein GT360_15810 [Vibrio astriarenae]|uniref:Uncharacterized protein n=1 Tax=Vibrio astriarenae TaxID=1481923 RepID=A0A7Z2YF12_9VIBR|nr:hypothetical protein [Vibrio astriarenae]QIA65027.1 hypothetical protein GT360_15810 [Vibrio astriarenae]
MRLNFSSQEKQNIFRKMISRTSGRHREMLDELCNAYPTPRTDKELMESLNIGSRESLKSLIHNAGSINPVKRIPSPCGAVSYVFCDQAAKHYLIAREMDKVLVNG